MNKAEYATLTWSSKAQVILSNLRVIPRLSLALYGMVCWLTWAWFTGLAEPTTQQVTAFSTIWGAAPAWFGFYLNKPESRGK